MMATTYIISYVFKVEQVLWEEGRRERGGGREGGRGRGREGERNEGEGSHNTQE